MTDEDRAAADYANEIDIYRTMKRAGNKRADMAKAVAPLVQAAFNAGLERAAVIADRYEAHPLMRAEAWSEEAADWHETGCIDSALAIAAAIRAEKEKPQ